MSLSVYQARMKSGSVSSLIKPASIAARASLIFQSGLPLLVFSASIARLKVAKVERASLYERSDVRRRFDATLPGHVHHHQPGQRTHGDMGRRSHGPQIVHDDKPLSAGGAHARRTWAWSPHSARPSHTRAFIAKRYPNRRGTEGGLPVPSSATKPRNPPAERKGFEPLVPLRAHMISKGHGTDEFLEAFEKTSGMADPNGYDHHSAPQMGNPGAISRSRRRCGWLRWRDNGTS